MNSADRPAGLQAWTDLCTLVDTVRVAVNRDLQAEAGLTLAESLVLCHVAMAPRQRLRMIDLAETLHIAKSAVTKTVDRLETRDLLTRTRDRDDRRTVYATLTPHGHKTFATAQPAYANAVARHFTTHLTITQIDALHKAAERALPQR